MSAQIQSLAGRFRLFRLQLIIHFTCQIPQCKSKSNIALLLAVMQLLLQGYCCFLALVSVPEGFEDLHRSTDPN